MRTYRENNGRHWAAAAPALLAATLAVVAAVEYVNGRVLRKNLKSALAGYGEARRLMDETAIFQHDYFKHMDVVRRMLADGQAERAQAYLKALTDRAEQASGAVSTGNYLIDLVFHSRLVPAREDDVRVCVTTARVPEKLRISDDALIALLSNAIDNAVAAAKAAGEGNGWIDVDLHGTGQMLFIGIANSCPGVDGAGPGKSRRKGYGQRIMQRIVERCGGVMKAESGGGSYRLSILLPVIAD